MNSPAGKVRFLPDLDPASPNLGPPPHGPPASGPGSTKVRTWVHQTQNLGPPGAGSAGSRRLFAEGPGFRTWVHHLESGEAAGFTSSWVCRVRNLVHWRLLGSKPGSASLHGRRTLVHDDWTLGLSGSEAEFTGQNLNQSKNSIRKIQT